MENEKKNGFIFKNGLPPCLIYVDEEGDWYHKGDQIFRKDILQIFYENLSRTPDGLYIINWHNEKCYLDVVDTPFVIQQIDMETTQDHAPCFYLTLKNIDRTERLDPTTLWVGERNILYCLVDNKTYPARFLRKAYYQFTNYIQQDVENSEFYVELDGNRYYIGDKPPQSRQ